MSVAANNILKLLSELSASADKVSDERASEFQAPRLTEWISIVKNKANSIVEGNSTESEEMPNLVPYLKGTNMERGARASTVLTEMQRLHLHKKGSRKFRKSSVKERVSMQENIPHTPKLKIPPIVLKKTAIGYQNIKNSSFATVTPISSAKRKSSSELVLENVKKPKTNNQESPRKKLLKAKNSSSQLPNYGTKSSVGVTNVSVLKENRNLRSKMEAKQEKAVENRKNIMALRQQKLEENKRNRDLKMEKTLQERLKLDKQKQPHTVLRSGQNLTPKRALQKIVAENKIPHTTPERETSVRKLNPVLQKNIKKHETEKMLNATYVTANEEPSTSSNSTQKGKTAKKTVKPPNLIEKQMTNSTNTSTPVQKKSSESYAITPARSSFVSYDISEIRSDSEEDEQETNNKPIPSWATGVRLRNALLQQHHHPIDTDELFGNAVVLPDLALIMGVRKKHYNKRTSSAVWNSSFSFC